VTGQDTNGGEQQNQDGQGQQQDQQQDQQQCQQQSTRQDQQPEQQNAQQDQKQQGSKSNSAQQQNQDDFDDKEIARLLLMMEESLSSLMIHSETEIFSSSLQLMVAGFLKDSEKNQRTLRDLMQRHGWFQPSPAGKNEYEQLIQSYKDTAPPVL